MHHLYNASDAQALPSGVTFKQLNDAVKSGKKSDFKVEPEPVKEETYEEADFADIMDLACGDDMFLGGVADAAPAKETAPAKDQAPAKEPETKEEPKKADQKEQNASAVEENKDEANPASN